MVATRVETWRDRRERVSRWLLSAAVVGQGAGLLWLEHSSLAATVTIGFVTVALAGSVAAIWKAYEWHRHVRSLLATAALGGFGMLLGIFIDDPLAQNTHAVTAEAHGSHISYSGFSLISWATLFMLVFCAPTCIGYCRQERSSGVGRTMLTIILGGSMLVGMAFGGKFLSPIIGRLVGSTIVSGHLGMVLGMVAGAALGGLVAAAILALFSKSVRPMNNSMFKIGIPLYDGVDLLDVTSACEMFSSMGVLWEERPISVVLLSETLEPVETRDGHRLIPEDTFSNAPLLDLLWVPGGRPSSLLAQMNNPVYTGYLKDVSRSATWVTSVCEGALLLAHAGLLDGYKATTHWKFYPCLRRYRKVNVVDGYPRYVVDGNRVTGGGISSGLDEALHLVQMIAGDDVAWKVRLFTQYFPNPVKQDIPGSDTCPLDSATRG